MAIPLLKICYAVQATWDYLISIWITWVGVSAFGIEMHQPRIIRDQIALSCKQVKYLPNAEQADIHRKSSNWPYSIVTSNKSIRNNSKQVSHHHQFNEGSYFWLGDPQSDPPLKVPHGCACFTNYTHQRVIIIIITIITVFIIFIHIPS